MGSGQGSDPSLNVGDQRRAAGRNAGDRRGLRPSPMASSAAPQGIRIPGLQASDKGPSPLVSLPVPWDCVAGPFDQTKGIMSADNCFKKEGFRAASGSPRCSQ